MRSIKIAIVFTVALLLSTEIFATTNPIPGIGVVIKRQPGSSQARTMTDKDGNFRFEGLEEGTYLIQVDEGELEQFFASVERKKIDKVDAPLTKDLQSEGGVSRTANTGNTGNTGNAGNSGQAGGIAEISITSADEVTIDGKTKKAGENKFYKDPTTTTIVCTVSKDGVLSGQLRAGISTSRSNLRTK